MDDIIDLIKRRWQWAIVIGVVVLVTVVLIVVAGAQIWQALMGLLGVGGAASPSLKKYAVADRVRVKQQQATDLYQRRQLERQERRQKKQESAARREEAANLKEIQKAAEQETPDQLRKRLLNTTRRPD